jgi:hypothetical protein
MSTRIEDLPGPIPEDIMDDIQNIQNNIRQQQLDDEIVRQNTMLNRQTSVDPDVYRDIPQQSNVTMNVKKRVKFREEDIDETLEQPKNKDTFTIIRDEINEENLLLLIIMILASRDDFDKYIKNIPVVSSYLTDSFVLLTITRCLLLLVLYIAFKHLVLPKIKI